MKLIRIITTTLLSMAVVFAMASMSFAEEYTVNYSCSYNGSALTTDFDETAYRDVVSSLEPGDSISFVANYQNKSDKTTTWYMKADVLKTLEEGNAAGSGYTGSLTNSSPDKTAPSVLFDNTMVGGDTKVSAKGLEQLTSGRTEYFGIGTLGAGQSGVITMSIRFDGDSENNDYEDTTGRFMMQFAVEDTAESGKVVAHDPDVGSSAKTGDLSHIILMIALMTAAFAAALMTVLSYIRDRRGGDRA